MTGSQPLGNTRLGDTGPGDTGRPDGVRILYCRCAYAQVVPAVVKDAVLDGLAAADRGFEMVPDLCEMAARRDPRLAELARGTGPLRIAACWPRAVQGLFTLADAPLPQQRVEIINMRTDTAEAVLAAALAPPTASSGGESASRPAGQPADASGAAS